MYGRTAVVSFCCCLLCYLLNMLIFLTFLCHSLTPSHSTVLQPHTHTITHSHTLLITCTSCCDEIKRTQGQDFSCSFSDSLILLSHLLSQSHFTDVCLCCASAEDDPSVDSLSKMSLELNQDAREDRQEVQRCLYYTASTTLPLQHWLYNSAYGQQPFLVSFHSAAYAA